MGPKSLDPETKHPDSEGMIKLLTIITISLFASACDLLPQPVSPAVRLTESPRSETAPSDVAPVTPAIEVKWDRSDIVTATAACPPSMTLTNVGTEPWFVQAIFGPSQYPLLQAEVSERFPDAGPPVVQPGAEITIDFAAVTDYPVMVFIDDGFTFEVAAGC